ncbi:hypothetical protein J2S71_000167 [Olsenella profusa DSM 13989]|uniref:hypothetical protein n=1 Tax=Olsenella profusa TaxID=138595 RepID=UPI0027819C81|nr:hypothetical protein [Olsenella profusa]MDP9858471.1 hypothetical protein [Olsenella profusa DSM 13989]
MPALIAHHLFGEEAARLLPEDMLACEEETVAFLLGNQGSDPLYLRFRALPQINAHVHQLALRMHGTHALDALLSSRESVLHLHEGDRRTARAFVLGLLGHYLLDSRTHPFVYAQENALCDMGVGLRDAHHEVHALIEGDIDSWLLWSMRGRTTAEIPSESYLASTAHIERIAGTLLSQVAFEVYGLSIDARQYGASVRDYRTAYRLLEPAGSPTQRALASLERLVRPHSMACALAHMPSASDTCAAANLEHHVWHDPSTNEPSTASFADLFQDALAEWPDLCGAFVRGDLKALQDLVGSRNYDGVPTEGGRAV